MHSPPPSSSKRSRTEAIDINVSPENHNIRTQSIPGNFQNLVKDPSKYKAIIIPIELAPLFETLCNELMKTLTKTNKENNVSTSDTDDVFESEDSLDDDLITVFHAGFESIKHDLDRDLKKQNDRDLVKDVPQGQFNSFKQIRKTLSKWYVTGTLLKQKLAGESTTKRYLKINHDFSVAVTDRELKDKCTTKLNKTKRLIENTLTSSVIKRALELNIEVRKLLDDSDNQISIIMKAYRVILKANRSLGKNQDNPPNNRLLNHNHYRKVSFSNNYRDREDKFTWNKRRPRINSNNSYHTHLRNFSNNQYEEEYPAPQHTNHDYRRYKRFEEEEDDPQPFQYRPRSFNRRSSWGNRFEY